MWKGLRETRRRDLGNAFPGVDYVRLRLGALNPSRNALPSLIMEGPVSIQPASKDL